MLTEIDKDYYCSCDFMQMGNYEPEHCHGKTHGYCEDCSAYHRKHPTPEQFKEDYGVEWTGAVYSICTHDCGEKRNCLYKDWSEERPMKSPTSCESYLVQVCACTPFGKPPQDWRPE